MKQVGPYRNVEELGRGTTGIVYKANDPTRERTVALKSIRPETETQGPAALETVRAMTALSHPSVAALYDVAQEDGQVYLAYEYVTGLSLETMLRRFALPEKPVLLQYFRQIAEGLDYIHAKGYTHRDIKPSNLLLEDKGAGQYAAKIIDLGVSQLVPHRMTGGVMVGTPSYLSPEEIQGLAVDARTDQFSLAVVIYEVLSGVKPFVADNLPAIFYQICKQTPRPIEQVNASLPAEVGSVLNRGLAKVPSLRFSSCIELVDALQKAMQMPGERIAAAPGLATQRRIEVAPLPPLPRRGQIQEEKLQHTARRSPLVLLAIMLGLSALAIAVTILLGQWDWRTLLPQKTAQAPPATASPTMQKTPEKSLEDSTAQKERQAQTKTVQNAPSQAASSPATAASNPVTGPPPTPGTVKPTAPTNPARPTPVRNQSSLPIPGATSAVTLLSEPPGARIVIDGNPATSCVAPCEISLPNGRHTATYELNGYNMARRVFKVPDETSLITPLGRSDGTLVVTSTPPGSLINIDNKPYGKTPATLHLPAGRHTLLLVNGPMQHQETVEITPGELETRSVRW